MLKENAVLSIKYIWERFFMDNKPIDGKRLRRILLVFPSGIGNSILAIGALKSLRNAYPNAAFSAIYVEKTASELFGILGGFEEILYLDEGWPLKQKLKFIKKVRKKKFDIAVIFMPIAGHVINFLLFVSGIKIRAGCEFKLDLPGNARYSSAFLTHSINYDTNKSEFEHNLGLLKYFQIPLERSIRFEIKRDVKANINYNSINIGIHVGVFNEKKAGWPKEKFLELMHLLNGSYHDAKFYLYGGLGENDNAVYFNQSRIPNLVNLISKNTLRETISRISQMDIFISNDTGLMHIAASQGVPLIALFCNTDVIKNRPVVEDDGKLAVIRKDLPCMPCYSWYRKVNCNNRKCVDLISAEEVFAAASSFINKYNKGRVSKGK